jgi:hypothetical protein
VSGAAPFRCAAASLQRDESVAGTASTVRAYLLVENDGPWGVDVWRDARMDPDVRAALRDRAQRARVRPLLVRRHRGHGREPGLRVFAAYADPDAPRLETTVVDSERALLDLDLAALGAGRSLGLTPTDRPLFLVCTHGRHDACCAELGRPTASALTRSHPEHTWEVSHIGGDRFAANLLVLPDGLYYGRVGDLDAPVLAQEHLDGRLDLDRLRGRSGFAFPVQVAEVAVRRAAGEPRHDAVRLLWTRTDGDDTHASFDVSGTSYAVQVRRSSAAAQQLTCRALRDNSIPTYEVVDLRAATP